MDIGATAAHFSPAHTDAFSLSPARSFFILFPCNWYSLLPPHHLKTEWPPATCHSPQVPVFYASELAAKSLRVYQTFINMMNEHISSRADVYNPFQFRFIRNIRDASALDGTTPLPVLLRHIDVTPHHTVLSPPPPRERTLRGDGLSRNAPKRTQQETLRAVV